MDFDELKDKYRAFPIWARLSMALIIGIAPGACSYFDEIEMIEQGLVDAQSREDAARVQFEADRKQKANIPKLEEELVFTEGQLEKAIKSLPDGYLIESILALTASNAKRAGINLTGFKPNCELKGEAEFNYVERTIEVTATGKYQQIAGFFDKMVHSDVMLFIREIVIEPTANAVDASRDSQAGTPFQLAELSRRNLLLRASFKIVVFRAMKPEEASYFDRKETCETDMETAAGMTPIPGNAIPLDEGEAIPDESTPTE